jgi:hypothetical protein
MQQQQQQPLTQQISQQHVPHARDGISRQQRMPKPNTQQLLQQQQQQQQPLTQQVSQRSTSKYNDGEAFTSYQQAAEAAKILLKH